MSPQITSGTPVRIVDVVGEIHSVDAAGEPVDGPDFRVVPIRRPLTSGGFDVVNWPADDVELDESSDRVLR